jgi:hypothetical protein
MPNNVRKSSGQILPREEFTPTLIRFCRAELVCRHYFHAFLRQPKALLKKFARERGYIRRRATLVDRAIGVAIIPMLAINSLATDSEKSEQRVSRTC